MEELFTHDELRMSTVRGKKGTLPTLDHETMDAILCMHTYMELAKCTASLFICILGFTMAKAEE